MDPSPGCSPAPWWSSTVNGSVAYTELVPEIAQEPNYDAALAAAGAA